MGYFEQLKFKTSTSAGYVKGLLAPFPENNFESNSKNHFTKSFQNSFFVDKNNPENTYMFIDTSGLSDTRSKDQDDLNLQRIIESTISQHQLMAIAYVVNGSESRITESIQNAFISFSSNLPDNLVKENLLLIVTKSTMSSSSFKELASVKEEQDKIEEQQYIFITMYKEIT
ncbi:8955_t:CDS:2, partial [Gigaspora rosea]